MEKRKYILGAVGTLILVLCAATIVAQESESDICVLEHLRAKQLTGKVVSARLDNEIESPIKGAVVELRHIGEQLLIAKTITDANGNFALPNMAPGAYSLAAKAPAPYRTALFSTAVEVRLSEAGTEKDNQEIVLGLGWLFNGCHGGYAVVRSKSKKPLTARRVYRFV